MHKSTGLRTPPVWIVCHPAIWCTGNSPKGMHRRLSTYTNPVLTKTLNGGAPCLSVNATSPCTSTSTTVQHNNNSTRQYVGTKSERNISIV